MNLYVSVYHSFPMKVCILYNCTAYIPYKSFRIITKIPFFSIWITTHIQRSHIYLEHHLRFAKWRGNQNYCCDIPCDFFLFIHWILVCQILRFNTFLSEHWILTFIIRNNQHSKIRRRIFIQQIMAPGGLITFNKYD